MTDPAPDDSLFAAELAFGLLDANAARAAEARAASDPAFAVLVERWREHAFSLFDGSAEAPSAHVWAAIKAALPANDDRESARPWRWATAAATAVASVLGVLALRPHPQPASAPPPVLTPAHPLVALLRAPGRREALAVSIAPDGRSLATSPAALDLRDRSPELWVIPAGGAPRSLGLVPPAPQWRPVSPALAAALVPGATLAVSVEPRGGSPTGKPTGPVILTATIAAT